MKIAYLLALAACTPAVIPPPKGPSPDPYVCSLSESDPPKLELGPGRTLGECEAAVAAELATARLRVKAIELFGARVKKAVTIKPHDATSSPPANSL